MLDIEGIQKRTDDAKHYVTCPKARNECKHCDDWFYVSTNFQSVVRSFVADIEALLADVHGSESHRAEIRKALRLPDSIGVVAGASIVVDARDHAKRELANTRGELDELRTRYARLVDSTDTFVAALVDERFKKDHAAMIAELESLRDERRKHLARINVLESSIASSPGAPIPMHLYCPVCHVQHIDAGESATKSHHTHACQSCGTVWRPAIVATVGVQFLPGFKNDTTLPANESAGQNGSKVESKAKDATSANVVPDDVLQRAVEYANKKHKSEPSESDVDAARRAILITPRNVTDFRWTDYVREFVKLWREGQAPDRPHPESVRNEPMCTCPPTSEYDDSCPRHGVVGLGFSKHSHIP